MRLLLPTALVLCAAWGEPLTEELLVWIETTLRRPVGRALATHSHDDRLGGAAALVRRGIPLFAHPLTRELAGRQNLPLPEALPALAAAGSFVPFGPAEIFYPGPGHAPDNLMVWLPGPRILFGGCAVRAATAMDLGNTADADLTAWPEALRRAAARYGEAVIVVPGHGAPGGADLLAHSLTLFAP